ELTGQAMELRRICASSHIARLLAYCDGVCGLAGVGEVEKIAALTLCGQQVIQELQLKPNRRSAHPRPRRRGSSGWRSSSSPASLEKGNPWLFSRRLDRRP